MATRTKDDRQLLQAAVWKCTHRDFKGSTDGVRTILMDLAGRGTCAVPLTSLSTGDLIARLPAALRAEWARPGWVRIPVDRGWRETWRTATAGSGGRWAYLERHDEGWRILIGATSHDSDPDFAGDVPHVPGEPDAAFAAACGRALLLITKPTE